MDPLEPKPPRPQPPAPPRPEWVKAPPADPVPPGVTPVMDFFQRRVEALERELALERERAQSAASLLAHQDALKNEVDSHLKALTDQLKREKVERDSQEASSHSRGRVEALEKRLDEMNSTFSQLLKDAVAGGGPSSAALAAELSAFRGALKDGMDGVARWRGELRELAALVPQVQSLAERVPQDEKLFEESVGRRLDEFSARLTRSLEDWKRAQEAARAELDARVEGLARQRDDLDRSVEAQVRALRDEQFKDRVAREAELSRQVGELASRLTELSAAQDGSVRGADSVRQGLEKVVSILTATPKAKDAVIAELEAEVQELRNLARDRQDALRRFVVERRDVEQSMGDGLMKLTGQVEDERARARAADARAAEKHGEVEALKARLSDAGRAVADRDARLTELNAQRDELARALHEEAEKVRRGIEERRIADAAAGAAADASLTELRRRLDEESARRASAEGAAADARAQMGALAEQTARSLQERDAALARFADWENERQRLLETIRKKDEMVSLLSSTFQGALKKGA
jgi:DNA repair exonuclease SbcCD ATPase subunit